MATTVQRTIQDAVLADVVSFTLAGDVAVAADMKVIAAVELFEDISGDPLGKRTFEITPDIGTLNSLAAIISGDLVADINAAIAARAEAQPDVPPT